MSTASTCTLETYFSPFRRNVIGRQQFFDSPFGQKKIIYADWTATGRAYQPIEDCLQTMVMPFVGNTHTETTITGTLMSKAYEAAKKIVKTHVHASEEDVLIFCGSGTTAAVNKLQRILGFRRPERQKESDLDDDVDRPVVFVTHMEHHSNHISWLETVATVEIISPDERGNVDLMHLRVLLEKYKHTTTKIAAITACSNVTGIETPYRDIARLLHAHGGVCFVDFASSAPYVDMNMHSGDNTYLDAIYFSPHKFLGGPGTPGVLIFNKKLYHNTVPDQPGGGTILYSNPWKAHEYVANIEQREDGGTPPFLGGIKAAMAIRLKEQMGVGNILEREAEMLEVIFERFSHMQNVELLEGHRTDRLGIISFLIKGAHYSVVVKLLNDRFGIQTRGGCSCAGTYGHWLLHVDKSMSYDILNSIHSGDLSRKPGWIRFSVHPIMTKEEIAYILDAIELTALHVDSWKEDYSYNPTSNEYSYQGFDPTEQDQIEEWFTIDR